MSYTQAWLENPRNPKIVLIECTVYDTDLSQEVSILLSNNGFMTSDALSIFNPIVVGNVSITEKLGHEGVVSMSYGDITINNSNGSLDSYLSGRYVWTNRNIVIYFGDPSWTVADIATLRLGNIFTIAFSGIMADISSSSKDLLNIKLRSKLEKLNTPVSDVKIGSRGVWPGGQQNVDQLSPLVFGEVHNISPVLVDPSQLEYLCNTGNTESIIEVRDNGAPVSVTASPSTGSYKLVAPSVGTITCSVQGVAEHVDLSTGNVTATYNNNVAKIIALICRNYGSNSANRLSAAELDLTQLSAFSSANTSPIGAVVSNRENVLSVCQNLASSVGAQLHMNRLGKLQLLKYGTAESVASVSITEDDIVFNSLSIGERIPVVASTKVGYAKNWTMQQNLTTLIPEQHKEMFATEWYTQTVEDATVKSRYRLEADPVQKDTALITTAGATTLATYLNNLFKVQKHVYKFTGTSKLMSLVLGQPVTLTHSRFGLSGGVSGQVVGLSPNWSTQKIEVEVLI